jgi:Tol biopolymer transport system component
MVSQYYAEDRLMHLRTVIVLLSSLAVLAALAGCRSTSGPDDTFVAEDRIHIRPAWSPDGRTIVFYHAGVTNRGLYLIETDGTNLRMLYPGDGIGATWSPDNQWLAFSLAGNLYKIRVNGDSVTKISTSPGAVRPAWSRDGRRIAFVRGGIYVLDLQLNTETDLFFTGDYPSWHPNFIDVVVQETIRDPVGIGGTYRFRAINPNTLALRTLHTFSSPDDCAFSSISPQGDAIIYGLKPANGLTQVWKIILSTGQHVRLTDDSGDYPAWSPDGRQIVYTRTALGDGGLWIMNADGTGKRRLTRP